MDGLVKISPSGDVNHDDSIEIQSALDSLCSNTSNWVNSYQGGTVLLGKGAFQIRTPIVLRRGVSLLGIGNSSTIHPKGGGTTLVVRTPENTCAIKNEDGFRYSTIGNFCVAGFNNPSAIGIYLKRASHLNLHNITVEGLNAGIYFDVVWGFKATSIVSWNNTIGLQLSGISTANFDSCIIQDNNVHDIIISGGNNFKFITCSIESHHKGNLSNIHFDNGPIGLFSFDTCHFERCANGDCVISSDAEKIRFGTFKNCGFSYNGNLINKLFNLSSGKIRVVDSIIRFYNEIEDFNKGAKIENCLLVNLNTGEETIIKPNIEVIPHTHKSIIKRITDFLAIPHLDL